MEALRSFWEAVAPYFGVTGVLGFIATCILLPLLRGKMQKVGSGFDASLKRFEETVKDAADKAADGAVERIKTLSFKQSIQPLVQSELKKVTERANEYIEGEVVELKASNEQIIAVLAALGAFFDDSIIPDSKKEAFAAAIKAAQSPVTEQEITVQEVVEEAPAKPVEKRGRKGAAIK